KGCVTLPFGDRGVGYAHLLQYASTAREGFDGFAAGSVQGPHVSFNLAADRLCPHRCRGCREPAELFADGIELPGCQERLEELKAQKPVRPAEGLGRKMGERELG